jgi:glycosyltransferase involved in cell wall biosynthesis
MKAALVHDWLTGYRGGEKVLELLCELLPGADIYTLVHRAGTTTPAIERHRIAGSWLSRLPGVGRYYRYLLPLMPAVAGHTRVAGYDLVIAVNHCVAHGVDARGSDRFVAYYLTPMRYAWGPTEAYFAGGPALDPRYWAMRVVRPFLRAWDRRAASRVSELVADSRCVRDRIRQYYGREAAIIYPPVDTDFYRPLGLPREEFYLWVGALAPYKRVELALEACRRLGRKLVVIGTGQAAGLVERVRPRGVTALGWQPDEVIREHYARATALIFPGEEDFGIVPLEAQACGCPVIAYAKGGVLETVIDFTSSAKSPTGIFFRQPTVESLVGAMEEFERRAGVFRPEALRKHALAFSRQRARAAFEACIMRSGAPEREEPPERRGS